MLINIFIKQVPESIDIEMDAKTHTLCRESIAYQTNPFDLFALEEGLLLKEKYGGKTRVLSMGPPQAVKALEESLSMGADDAYLLSDPLFSGADTYATSYTLSSVLKLIGIGDLILVGKQATDGDTGQVGPELAEHLKITHVTNVRSIKEIINGKKVIISKMTEKGTALLEVELPALLTITKTDKEPRTPTLRDIVQSKRKFIDIFDSKRLKIDTMKTGLKGSPTKVIKTFKPEYTSEGRIFPMSDSISLSILLKELQKKQENNVE
ncbi:MAG: electron transfer flavoprotein subunit beta/FixA family protein [Spirochaetaceae bacterium]|nr:electron transfer flavoprotein subunit beta/FixA family protein [Spirochaetaceae bacterium]